MSSTKYPCYDNPVHIPGIPGTFANVIVEIDDNTREVLGVTAFDGTPLDPTSLQPLIPEAAKASSAPPKSKEN